MGPRLNRPENHALCPHQPASQRQTTKILRKIISKSIHSIRFISLNSPDGRPDPIYFALFFKSVGRVDNQTFLFSCLLSVVFEKKNPIPFHNDT